MISFMSEEIVFVVGISKAEHVSYVFYVMIAIWEDVVTMVAVRGGAISVCLEVYGLPQECINSLINNM